MLGWRVESNWTDPVLFVIYTVAKPIASLLLLVVMIQIIGAGGTGQSDETVMTFVVLGSALWATIVAGIAGPAWSVLEDRERYRMLKYLYVEPVDVPRPAHRARLGAAHRRRDRDGRRARVRRDLPRRPDRHHGDRLAAVRHVARAGHRPDPRDRRAARRGLPPDAPGELVVPGGVRGRDVPRQRRRVPARDPARPARVARPASTRSPGGSRACARRWCPAARPSIGGAGIAVDSCHRNHRAGRRDDRARLVRDRGAGYTRRDRHLPASEHRARDLGLLDRTTGS